MRLETLVQLSINVIFCMHIVGTAHGNTVSPPWVTLSGCFNLSSNKETSHIQKNEPTQCFKMCPVYQSVGLKNTSCICNPQYNSSDILINRRCNLSCPGKSEVSCGSDGVGNELMSVYRRDATLPVGNGSSSYGYGYVVVSGSNKTYYASDYNTSLQYGHLCYNDFVPPGPDQCLLEKMTLSTWEDAMTACNNGKSGRLITVSDVSNCRTGAAFDGTYWIGIYREKPDFTTSTTATSTSSTTTSTSPTSSKPALSSKPTTGSRPNDNSTIPVIEQTSKASSSDGKNIVVVAASVTVIVVAILVVLASILICKKRKLLCFKERQKGVEMDDSNSDAPPEITELISTSVPPGSTMATFQTQYQNDIPETAREREIQSGQSCQTVTNSQISSTNTSDNNENRVRSDMKRREKHKKKRKMKRLKNNKHRAIVDKEYEKNETNGKTNVESLEMLTNDNHSAVNGMTGHSNGESEDNGKKMNNNNKEPTREGSYSDDTMNNASAEPGSDFVSVHHSKRTIVSASLDKVQVTGKQPDQPNDKVNDLRRKKTEQYETPRKTHIETLTKEYDGLFVAPAETPVIEEHADLHIQSLRRKHKEKRRKDKERVNENGTEQEDQNLKEVYKEPNDLKTDTRKNKHKKRKESRERSKEKVLNGYDEIVDAPRATPVLEEQADLHKERSNKKHKKRKRKKDKKRGDEDVAEQKGLDLEDKNDDAA